MGRLVLTLALVVLAGGARAQGIALVGGGGGPSPPSGVGCSQATAFLAGTSGENTGALTTMICGLVSDGLIDSDASMASTGANPNCGAGSPFDRIFIFAMANSTDALLDVCGNSSGATTGGSPTFTANAGFASVAGSGNPVIDTGFNPTVGTPHFTQNSAHIAVWVMNNVGIAIPSAGYASGGPYETVYAKYADDKAYCDLNNAGTDKTFSAVPTAVGLTVCTRSDSSNSALYKNGSQIASSSADTSVAMINRDLFAVGIENNASSQQEGIVTFGSDLSSGANAALYSRGCTYLTAVHGSC